MSDSESRESARLFEELPQREEAVDRRRPGSRSERSCASPSRRRTDRLRPRGEGSGRGNVAEALLGSDLFGVPMFVEGGTREVAASIVGQPAYFSGTVLFAVALVVGIRYVADVQDVRVRDPIPGVIPHRLVGIPGVSVLTATVTMTAWGRVEWGGPWLALASVAVASVPMSVGAAPGGILPAT